MENIKLWKEYPAKLDDCEMEPELLPFLCDNCDSCVIICPGGGYSGRCESYEGVDLARWFNSIGISAFILRYRVYPYHYPCGLADLHRAVRYIRHNSEMFGINKNKIGAMGFSAGGHLVSAGSTHEHTPLEDPDDPIDRESSKLNAAILCYPVITFSELGHKGSAVNFLGDAYNEENIKKFSSELQVSSFTPPTFLWHTFKDSCVDVRNSLMYATACKENGIPFELHVFPEGEHGLGMAQSMPTSAGQWCELLKNWLKNLDF